MRMVLTVRARQAERCALCHDALEGEHFTCSGCGTRVHASCRRELGRACPSLGCPGEPGPRSTHPGESAPRYRVWRARDVVADASAARRRSAFLRGYLRGCLFGVLTLVTAAIVIGLVAH